MSSMNEMQKKKGEINKGRDEERLTLRSNK